MAQVTSNIVPSGLLGGLNKPAPAGGLSGYYNTQTGGFGPTPNMSTPLGPRYAPPSTAPVAPAATPKVGAVKSHEIGADGAVKTTYHNPDQGTTKNSSAGQTTPQNVAPQPQFSGIMGAGTGSIVPSGGIIDAKTGQPQAVGGSADAGQTGTTGTAGGQTTSNVPPPTDTSPQGLLQHLAQFGQQDPGLNDLYQQQQQLDRRFADMTGNILNTPGDLNYQTGRLAALQSEYNTAKANLAQNYSQRLSARTQQIGALQGVAGMIPTPILYGAFGQGGATGAPTTGTTGAGPTLTYNLQQDSQNFARAVINGTMTYQQAKDSLAYQGNIATGNLNAAIQAYGGDPLKLEAQGAATQSNIQTGGTAATGAAASGLQKATQDYVDANTAYTAADNQANNLKQVLDSTGINNNPQFVNQKINQLQNQLGSANYTSFITALTELKQKYTTLLSTVGAQTPTVNGVQADTILNENSTPAQINAAIDALNNAAYAGLKPLYDKIGTYQSQLGTSGTSNTNEQSSSSNIYSF